MAVWVWYKIQFFLEEGYKDTRTGLEVMRWVLVLGSALVYLSAWSGGHLPIHLFTYLFIQWFSDHRKYHSMSNFKQ